MEGFVMKERTKLVVKIVAFLVFMAVILFGYYSFKRNTQISPIGGKDETTAVEVSQNEKIKVKVFIEKNDRLHGMYVYWDDDKENKQKLKKGIFTAKGEVEVPNTLGIHKLTIEIGFIKIKYDYYYEVLKGKSD